MKWLEKFRSLRMKMILWFLGVALIPLIVSTFVSYSVISGDLIEDQRRSSEEYVAANAQAMNEWLNRRMGEVRLAARTDALKSGDNEQIARYLTLVAEQTDAYQNVLFAGSDGVIVAASGGGLGLNISDREYFRRAMRGEASFSEVLHAKDTGERIVSIAAPVAEDNGAIIGVVAAAVRFDALVETYLSGKSGRFLLIDAQGIIQHIDNEQMIGKGIEDDANTTDEFKALLWKGMKEQGSDFYRSASGAENLLAFAPIEEAGYGLYISIPKDTIVANAKKAQSFMLGVAAVATVFIILVSIAASGSIARPVLRIAEQARRVAQGDLRDINLRIRSKDEIGQLAEQFRIMVDNLRDSVTRMAESAEQLAAASQEISAGSEEIASGSMEQANAAQSMNQMLKELTQAIETVAVAAEAASLLSDETVRIAQEGGVVVNHSIEDMTGVNEQMRQLEDESSKIGEIIEVIDDIAEQTNLLALNAAIEAARAGEQGRGFAVVADEVRKLAERSGEATKQIAVIIKGMQHKIETSVRSVSEAVEKTAQIRVAFDRVIDKANESSSKVGEIAAASEEQSAQSREVLRFVESISATSEEMAASTEQTATTTQSLAQLAENLRESVAFYRTN